MIIFDKRDIGDIGDIHEIGDKDERLKINIHYEHSPMLF